MTDEEYLKQLEQNFQRNKGYSKKGEYQTTLQPAEEIAFRRWVMANGVPFNPEQGVQDYDMRGFWKALMSKDPKAMTAVNPNDQQIHFPDFWKTPYHQTFSSESQWAGKGAPTWNDKDQLVLPGGQVIFDERAKNGN